MNFDPYNQHFTGKPKMSLTASLKMFFLKNHPVNRTILVISVVYALFLLTRFYMYLFAVPFQLGEASNDFFVRYLALPSQMSVVEQMPWTIVTHFLLHTGFFQLILNLVVLSVFGKLFFDFWRMGRFLLLLILAAIIGAAGYVFLPEFLGLPIADATMNGYTGISASAFALMFYMLVFMPEHRFVYMMLVKIPMKYVVLLFVVIDLFFFDSKMPGVHLAHLSAALFGGAFALIAKFFVQKRAAKPHFRVSKSSEKKKKAKFDEAVKTKTDEEYNLLKKQKQEKLDFILDKISKSGYGSLSQDEKDFLFYESKR
jgi:membrane associated rhomboid family serine protease